MREALEVIADDKKSKELYTLAQTGKRTDDSSAGWQAGPAVDLNVPVGLTNIANTCYLNSLLQVRSLSLPRRRPRERALTPLSRRPSQYFFTVREVRDTILAFHDTPTPSSQQGQLRVGGRLVSLAEVKRSKRCASTFPSDLFPLARLADSLAKQLSPSSRFSTSSSSTRQSAPSRPRPSSPTLRSCPLARRPRRQPRPPQRPP